MADIVLINPKFTPSYWGLNYAMPLLNASAVLPVINLPLLAALTPPQHAVTLIDENVAGIDFDRCARADIVGLTGMNVQRARMREILGELGAEFPNLMKAREQIPRGRRTFARARFRGRLSIFWSDRGLDQVIPPSCSNSSRRASSI